MLSMGADHDVLLRYMIKHSEMIENKFGAIEEKIEKLKETCEISDNSRISGIFQKLSNEDMINELNFNDLDNELLVKSNSETNKYVNSTQAFTRKIQSLSYSRKKSNRIASKNSITQNSIALYSTWDLFINKVMSSKMIKEECVKINQILSDEIFSCLTENSQFSGFDAYSYKVFISKAFEYICTCEKKASNIYIIMYMFRVFSNVIIKCKEADINQDTDSDLKQKIEEDILNIFDTSKNIQNLFTLISEDMEKNIYNDQIFTLSSYFMNNMLNVRPFSSQEKFKIMFMNHASSQSFFKKIDKYFSIFSNKITEGVLEKKFRLDDHSSTATDKPYYANEILERQIIECLKGLCSKSNTFMQDYMRSQFKNNRTYNFVDIL